MGPDNGETDQFSIKEEWCVDADVIEVLTTNSLMIRDDDVTGAAGLGRAPELAGRYGADYLGPAH